MTMTQSHISCMPMMSPIYKQLGGMRFHIKVSLGIQSGAYGYDMGKLETQINEIGSHISNNTGTVHLASGKLMIELSSAEPDV